LFYRLPFFCRRNKNGVKSKSKTTLMFLINQMGLALKILNKSIVNSA
jgi:hypothetical protein